MGKKIELEREHYQCVCGIHLITLERFSDDTDVDIIFWEEKYYTESILKEYFKRLWSAIANKRYMIYNIILTKEDAKRLADSLLSVGVDAKNSETVTNSEKHSG